MTVLKYSVFKTIFRRVRTRETNICRKSTAGKSTPASHTTKGIEIVLLHAKLFPVIYLFEMLPNMRVLEAGTRSRFPAYCLVVSHTPTK